MAYPGYQRFFLACDEELRRPQADTSSAEGRRHERNSGLDRVEKNLFKIRGLLTFVFTGTITYCFEIIVTCFLNLNPTLNG